MHGQQNDKYTEMHGQQNDKYTEMHGQQNVKKKTSYLGFPQIYAYIVTHRITRRLYFTLRSDVTRQKEGWRGRETEK